MNEGLRKEQLFTSAPVGKAVISLAVPTVIAQLITVIYNMADTFFIGQLGDPNQVAAATLAMPVFMFLTAFANLFGIGGASMISRSLGTGDHEKARKTSAFCIWAAVGVSLVYGITVVLLKNTLLSLLGADKAVRGYCSSYIFWTVGVGAVPTVLNAELAHLIRSEGYSGQASFGVALGGILNMILDPIFIFLFQMEITGAAIATMLSNVAATVFFLLFLFKIRKISTITPSPKYLLLFLPFAARRCALHRNCAAGTISHTQPSDFSCRISENALQNNKGLCSSKYFAAEENIPLEVLSVGLPSFMMTLMSTVSNLTLNKIISGYSNEAIAGMGIAKKIDLMAFAIAQGMTQGTLPLIGYNYSSGNHRRMLSALKVLLFDCLGAAVGGMVFMFFGAASITRCFINDAATVEYGRTFLQIVCLACPTTALNFLAITIFQSTGKKVQPLVLSLLRKGGLDIPLMFLFHRLIGVSGIAWATPLADTLALLVSLLLTIPYLRKLIPKSNPPL